MIVATIMAVILGSALLFVTDNTDAETFGSSSEPLTSLTGNLDEYAGDTVYLEVGSTVELSNTNDDLYWCDASSVTSGFGLSLTGEASFGQSVNGTVTRAGTISITLDLENEEGPWTDTITIVAVEETTVEILSVGGMEATVGYQYTYNVQTTPSDATIQISGVSWLSVSGHTISGTPTSAGSFTLQITASADGYISATQTVVIVVDDEPAEIGAPVINDVSYAVDNTDPYRLTFVVDATDASSVSVDYGDGTNGTGMSSTHTYSSSGTYTVRVTATNSAGSASSSLTVLIADSTPGTSVQYNHRYTFTLGIDTEGITPTVSGCPFLGVTTGSNYVTVSGTPSSTAYVGQTYSVTLTVGDFSMSWNLTVTEGSTVPDAGFTYETDGLTVIVTSTAANADLTFYQWTDGGSFVQSNTGTTRYTYSEPGTYTITQRVTATIDGQTITDEFSATITVEGGSPVPTPEPEEGVVQIIGVAMAVLGLIALIAGAYTGNYIIAAIAAVIAVAGAVLWWMF